jgi:hypothetical protein
MGAAPEGKRDHASIKLLTACSMIVSTAAADNADFIAWVVSAVCARPALPLHDQRRGSYLVQRLGHRTAGGFRP